MIFGFLWTWGIGCQGWGNFNGKHDEYPLELGLPYFRISPDSSDVLNKFGGRIKTGDCFERSWETQTLCDVLCFLRI